MIVSYVLATVLIFGVFALPRIRGWLEKSAEHAHRQEEWIVAYKDAASDFLRLTDPDTDADTRDFLIAIGNRMLDGTRLIRGIIAVGRRSHGEGSRRTAAIQESFEKLPEDAKHALGRALASALIASSYQSVLFGWIYRRTLQLMIDPNANEIHEPVQVIYRFTPDRSRRSRGKELVGSSC